MRKLLSHKFLTFFPALLALFFFSEKLFAQFTIVGDATSSGGGCYVLTPDLGTQHGDAWNNTPINLSQSLSIEYNLYFGSHNGADGIAFVLQNQGTAVLGAVGGGIGYAGITPSVVVEFDTYQNGCDPVNNHMAVTLNGDPCHTDPVNVGCPVISFPSPIVDGNWHAVKITWDPVTYTLQAYLDCKLYITYTNDIVTNIFSGNPNVWWGFTASTGGSTNLQQMCYASPITINITTTIGCSGQCNGSAAVTNFIGGTPPYTYLWAPIGQSTSSISALCAGTYTATVTTASGCTATDTVTIFQPLPLTANDSIVNNISCYGGNGSATVSSAGGFLPYTYNWSDGETTQTATSFSIAGIYSITITDSKGCTSTQTVAITQLSNLTVTITGNSSICPGNSITLNASGGSNYSWSNGITTSYVSVSPSATTTYSVIVSNGACADTTSTLVTVNPIPTATVSNVVICAGNTATLTAGGGNSYSWDPGGLISPSIIVNPTATTNYTVTVTNANGCTDTAISTVTVNPNPTVSITGNMTICTGDATTLNASGGGTYNWNTGGTTVAIAVAPSSTTTYSVAVTNSFGCTTTAMAVVIVSPPPIASATSETICSGQNATLTASGGGNYLWSNGATTSSIQINPITNSTYSVIVSIGTCSDTASATVTVNALPAPVAWSNVTIVTGASTTLSASGGVTYSWSSGASGSAITVSPPLTAIYCVWVSSGICTDTACVTVTVEPMDCSEAATGKLYLPDAFSPNNDGENDFLRIYFGNMQCIKSFELHIYNRWGEEVFETNDPDFRWDGSYKSKPENTAVFVYYMNATLITGEKIIRKGNINLLR